MPPLEEVMAVHDELRETLPDIDRFWVRWNAFVERRGGCRDARDSGTGTRFIR